MPKNRFLGLILLGCGIWLLWLGRMAAYNTEGSWFSQVMAGTVTDQALLYWTAGIVMCIAGILCARRV